MAHTTDQTVLNHIEQLVAEEKTLYHKGEISDDEKATARRRSTSSSTAAGTCCASAARLREFGKNPDDAEVRPAKTVENYRGVTSGPKPQSGQLSSAGRAFSRLEASASIQTRWHGRPEASWKAAGSTVKPRPCSSDSARWFCESTMLSSRV